MSTRTKWAEEFAEVFASVPLVRECVFRSPKRLDRGIEKEVCDLLIALRGDALLLQMKCQEDPSSRWGGKLASWILKQAEGALGQIGGAIGTVEKMGIWCDHPRRGKVSFRAGELRPVWGIVAVENFGERVTLPSDFPLALDGVPIAYFSVNDFLNVIKELRAFPEILGYLQQRSVLPTGTLRTVGGERFLFLHYLKHDFSFDGWSNFKHAAREAYASDPLAAINAAREGNEGAHLIEAVADDLAARASDYLEGMPPELAQRYDAPTRRRNYLRMQEELCDLPLRGRRLLGQQLWKVIQELPPNSTSDMTFASAYADSKPDFLYVFAATRGIHRSVVLTRGLYLLQCGLAHYAKSVGMFVADRDGKSFELAYVEGLSPTEEARAAGQRLFGHLRVFDYWGSGSFGAEGGPEGIGERPGLEVVDMGGGMRRPGGNWSVRRIDKAEDYQTVLYEIDMLRFSYGKVTVPPDGARDGDMWAYLESFLVHYRNLLDFFGKASARNTDLTLLRPQEIWSVRSGLAGTGPAQNELDEMLAKGRRLWEKYEDSSKRDDTISRYLQHCTTYRTSPKQWYPVEMMSEIEEVLEVFERYLPGFKPATNSGPVDRAHFLGGGSMSTHSGTSAGGR